MQDSDAPTMKNGTVILKPSDVLHIPDLGFDGLVGYSPIAMAKNATRLCMDITRQNEDVFEESENARPAVYYAVAYLYEHREEADHHALIKTACLLKMQPSPNWRSLIT